MLLVEGDELLLNVAVDYHYIELYANEELVTHQIHEATSPK
jgi:hypothetical protein